MKHFNSAEINDILASNAPQDVDAGLPSYQPGVSRDAMQGLLSTMQDVRRSRELNTEQLNQIRNR